MPDPTNAPQPSNSEISLEDASASIRSLRSDASKMAYPSGWNENVLNSVLETFNAQEIKKPKDDLQPGQIGIKVKGGIMRYFQADNAKQAQQIKMNYVLKTGQSVITEVPKGKGFSGV